MKSNSLIKLTAICFSLILVCFCGIGVIHHDCDNDMCKLCFQMSATESALKIAVLAPIFVCVVAGCIFGLCCYINSSLNKEDTLFDLRVRLLI